jgi:RimJ/RimL family protein N-acetyltransferase
VKTVWIKPDSQYLNRCSRCGKYRKEDELREHWFFRGVYCLTCILDVLYDNCRNLEERP